MHAVTGASEQPLEDLEAENHRLRAELEAAQRQVMELSAALVLHMWINGHWHANVDEIVCKHSYVTLQHASLQM